MLQLCRTSNSFSGPAAQIALQIRGENLGKDIKTMVCEISNTSRVLIVVPPHLAPKALVPAAAPLTLLSMLLP